MVIRKILFAVLTFVLVVYLAIWHNLNLKMYNQITKNGLEFISTGYSANCVLAKKTINPMNLAVNLSGCTEKKGEKVIKYLDDVSVGYNLFKQNYFLQYQGTAIVTAPNDVEKKIKADIAYKLPSCFFRKVFHCISDNQCTIKNLFQDKVKIIYNINNIEVSKLDKALFSGNLSSDILVEDIPDSFDNQQIPRKYTISINSASNIGKKEGLNLDDFWCGSFATPASFLLSNFDNTKIATNVNIDLAEYSLSLPSILNSKIDIATQEKSASIDIGVDIGITPENISLKINNNAIFNKEYINYLAICFESLINSTSKKYNNSNSLGLTAANIEKVLYSCLDKSILEKNGYKLKSDVNIGIIRNPIGIIGDINSFGILVNNKGVDFKGGFEFTTSVRSFSGNLKFTSLKDVMDFIASYATCLNSAGNQSEPDNLDKALIEETSNTYVLLAKSFAGEDPDKDPLTIAFDIDFDNAANSTIGGKSFVEVERELSKLAVISNKDSGESGMGNANEIKQSSKETSKSVEAGAMPHIKQEINKNDGGGNDSIGGNNKTEPSKNEQSINKSDANGNDSEKTTNTEPADVNQINNKAETSDKADGSNAKSSDVNQDK